MTISSTGNKAAQKRNGPQLGIALFEVLVSVAILAGGLLAVFQPLYASISGLHDAESRLVANRLVSDQLWGLQELAWRRGRFPLEVPTPVLTSRDRVFYYGVSHRSVGADKGLYQVDAVVAWQTGSRRKNIKRSVYVGVL